MRTCSSRVEAYDNFVKQSVAALDDDRRRDHPRLHRAGGQGLSCVILFHSQAGQFGFKVAQARPEQGQSARSRSKPAGVGGREAGCCFSRTFRRSSSTATTSRSTRAGRRSGRTASSS